MSAITVLVFASGVFIVGYIKDEIRIRQAALLFIQLNSLLLFWVGASVLVSGFSPLRIFAASFRTKIFIKQYALNHQVRQEATQRQSLHPKAYKHWAAKSRRKFQGNLEGLKENRYFFLLFCAAQGLLLSTLRFSCQQFKENLFFIRPRFLGFILHVVFMYTFFSCQDVNYCRRIHKSDRYSISCNK